MIARKRPVKNKRLIVILSIVTCLLLVPLIATQLSNEVNWDETDFLVMGALLYGTALLCETVLRKVKSTGKRFFICGLILVALFLVWAELAVGLFRTPFAGS